MYPVRNHNCETQWHTSLFFFYKNIEKWKRGFPEIFRPLLSLPPSACLLCTVAREVIFLFVFVWPVN